MRARRLLIAVGGLMLVVGSRLPWISVPVLFGVEGPAREAIEIGWEDNGMVTGGIGLALLLGSLFLGEKRAGIYPMAGATLAAVAILVVAGCAWRVVEIDPGAGFLAATDVGLYLTLLGGLLVLPGTLLKPPAAVDA